MRRIRLSFSRIPSPQSSTPQLFEIASRVSHPRIVDRSDEHARDAAEPEATHRQGGAINDPVDGLEAEETTLSMRGTLAAGRARTRGGRGHGSHGVRVGSHTPRVCRAAPAPPPSREAASPPWRGTAAAPEGWTRRAEPGAAGSGARARR